MTDKRKPETAGNTGPSSPSGGETPGVGPAAKGAPNGPLASGQRWSVARKREVVLRLLRGESLEALSRELGVEPYRLAEWREKAVTGIDATLKVREGDPAQAALDAAMQRIGELTMANELLWQRVRKPSPLAKRRS